MSQRAEHECEAAGRSPSKGDDGLRHSSLSDTTKSELGHNSRQSSEECVFHPSSIQRKSVGCRVVILVHWVNVLGLGVQKYPRCPEELVRS